MCVFVLHAHMCIKEKHPHGRDLESLSIIDLFFFSFIYAFFFFFLEPESVKYQCDSIICRNFLNIYFLAPKVRVGVPSEGELEEAAGKADCLFIRIVVGRVKE